MFNSHIIKQLDKIEDNLSKLEDQYTAVKSTESEVVSKLQFISEVLTAHMEREEEESKRVADILTVMAEKLNNIEKELNNHSRDLEISLNKQKDHLLDHCDEVYAKKSDLNNGLNSLRTTAKYIWYTITIFLIGLGWSINALIQIYE